MAIIPALFSIGEASQVDPGAVLGAKPGRRIQTTALRIGHHAVIRSGTVIYLGSVIGNHFETGHHVVVREENHIGDHVSIWNNVTIDYGCDIGCHVKIHCNVYVAQFTVLEDDVFLAPGVMIANDPHPLCGLCLRGPTIKAGARVGVNVTILPHVTIGERALIGAGSVVTRDIPPFAVAYGNPARPQRHVDDLPCPFGLVEHAYEGGLDVKTRNLR